MKNNIMQIIKGYLIKNIKYIISLTVFLCIFLIIFILYNAEIQAVWYSFFLCFCFLSVFFSFDFCHFYKKHIVLNSLKNYVITEINDLPESIDIIEKDYQKLIYILHNHIKESEIKATTAKSEMLDYYTLWAHQIKTPISAMNLLMQSVTDSREMKLELFKIEKYVEMALQYLKLENISSDMILKQYKLKEIINQAVKQYSLFFIQKKIKLDIKNFECDVITDKKWLLFVLEQIISNALKYTYSGTITIYMDYSKAKTLVIEDTGIGIIQEDLPRIFEKGFTGVNGRIYQKSTGLGLYLCKSILKRLSHDISIDSEIGKGTKVFIDLYQEKYIIE